MDQRNTATLNRQSAVNLNEFGSQDTELVYRRLNNLLELNAKPAHEKVFHKSAQEKLESEMMRHPLDTKKVFAYFGLLLGTFAPASIFAKFIIESHQLRTDDLWILGVMLIMNLLSASVGCFSGKLIGQMVSEVEKYSWLKMLLLLPFIGIIWGIMAGGAGGVIVFLFGALVGAMFGALVGAVAVPLFAVFHRLLKTGEMIEMKHFLPVAFGVVLTICAYILGS